MKAICVTANRSLEVRDVPTPGQAARGHVLVKVEACAINPGDKFFLSQVGPANVAERRHDVWGASAAGTIVEVGSDLPRELRGRKVAVYRSLVVSSEAVGCWSEIAHVPWGTCARVPDGVTAEAVSGSLVNVITPYAFLDRVTSEGHRGVVVTGGASATGVAMIALAQARNVPLVVLARDAAERARLEALGADAVVAQDAADFDDTFRRLAADRATTAVFDGVGGELSARIARLLPRGSTTYIYGALGGPTSPLTIPTGIVLGNGFTLTGFSNFQSATVRDPERLRAALDAISELLVDPRLHTKPGQRFPFSAVTEAMREAGTRAEKPILVPG